MRINQEVSQAEHVAGILAGTSSQKSIAAVRPVAYRAPVHLLAVVDSMAAHSKKSRNQMLNLLLQVGIDEVRDNLDEDVIEKLSIAEAQILSDLSGENLETDTE